VENEIKTLPISEEKSEGRDRIDDFKNIDTMAHEATHANQSQSEIEDLMKEGLERKTAQEIILYENSSYFHLNKLFNNGDSSLLSSMKKKQVYDKATVIYPKIRDCKGSIPYETKAEEIHAYYEGAEFLSKLEPFFSDIPAYYRALKKSASKLQDLFFINRCPSEIKEKNTNIEKIIVEYMAEDIVSYEEGTKMLETILDGKEPKIITDIGKLSNAIIKQAQDGLAKWAKEGKYTFKDLCEIRIYEPDAGITDCYKPSPKVKDLINLCKDYYNMAP